MSERTEISLNKRILIASDSADELNTIQHLLVDEFGSCLKASNEHDGLQLFSEYKPLLLILAFDGIEKAKNFYLTLYRNNPKINNTSHQTLLLCKSNESSTAYQLCKSMMFSDYFADRPLYDPFRLRLSVTQAINRCNHDRYSSLLNNKIENIVDKLHRFDQHISKDFVVAEGEAQEITNKFQYFIQRLETDIGQLESEVLTKGLGAGLTDIDRKQLGNKFDNYRKKSLIDKSKSVIEQVNQMESRLERINKKYHVHVNAIDQESQLDDVTRVMLVDDDELYRDSITIILKDFGIQVIAVNDGKAALEKLQYTHPDLILLDYNMPGIDGISTLTKIRLSPTLSSIPVIMLTGVSDRKVVKKSLEAGATDFIVKPSERAIILSKINGALGKNFSP